MKFEDVKRAIDGLDNAEKNRLIIHLIGDKSVVMNASIQGEISIKDEEYCIIANNKIKCDETGIHLLNCENGYIYGNTITN